MRFDKDKISMEERIVRYMQDQEANPRKFGPKFIPIDPSSDYLIRGQMVPGFVLRDKTAQELYDAQIDLVHSELAAQVVAMALKYR